MGVVWRVLMFFLLSVGLCACHEDHASSVAIHQIQTRLERALQPLELPNADVLHQRPLWSQWHWRWSGEIVANGKLQGVFLQALQESFYFAEGVVLPDKVWSVKAVRRDAVVLQSQEGQISYLKYNK